MNTRHYQTLNNVTLTNDQKREIDELIIRFCQKLISFSDMCDRIETIKYGHDDIVIFSCPQIPGSPAPDRFPVH